METAQISRSSERRAARAADDRSPGRHGPAGLVARRCRRLASWRLWALSAAVFVPFAVIFFASSAPFAIPSVEAACGQVPPDLRFTTTGAEVAEFLTACGPDGRAAYRNLQLADLAYPAVVGLFLASSLALTATRLSAHRLAPTVAVVPLVASAFDYLENLLAWLALASHPEAAATNGLLGLASAAKASCSWLAVGLLVVGLTALLARGLAALAPSGHERRGRGEAGWARDRSAAG